MDAADFERLGLYDPDAPDADDLLATLGRLVEMGATPEELVAFHEYGPVEALAGRLAIRGERPLTMREAARDAGIALEDAQRVWRAAGLAVPDPDAPVLFETDRELFVVYAASTEVLPQEAVLQMTRVMGSAVARVADAAISAYVQHRLPAMDQATRLERVEAGAAATRTMVLLPDVLRGLFAHHALDAQIRAVASRVGTEYGLRRAAVGFVDLVGSTRLSQVLGPAEVASIFNEFEAFAIEQLADRGGRLVKLIGDEAMLVALEPRAAVEVALGLVEFAAVHSRLDGARGAVTFGSVGHGEGDVWGPVVNLAARIVREAEPGEVLVTAEVRDGVTDAGLAFVAAGERKLRDFAEPVPVFRATRT